MEINLTISASPADPSGNLTLSLTHKFLRSCGNPAIAEINSTLQSVTALRESDRLENRLQSECRKVTAKWTKTIGGNNRSKFDKKVKQITVYPHEIESQQKENITPGQTDQAIQATPVPCGSESSPLPPLHATPKVGVRIDNAGSRSHKKRIVKALQENTLKALEFVETYGVIPKQLLCETFVGEHCAVSLDGVERSNVSYNNMSSERMQEVKELLNVCDKAMISDAAYHEIAMHSHDLPRKSQIIACRNEMNSKYNVKRTPGLQPGSYLSVKDELVRDLTYLMESGHDLEEPIIIKVSGDGAKVSKVSNFVVISYCVAVHMSQSHIDQKVIAIVNCEENYGNLRNCLGPVFDEINALNRQGDITIMDKTIKLEIVAGGDMKFIQLLLGLNSSISTYACPWCKVSKDDRGDITLPEDHYHARDMIRSINEIKGMISSGRSGKQAFGTKEPPLLDVEPANYIPDELHLLMRVTDVLLRNVIDDARSKDNYAKITGQATDNLELLVKAIQSCGLTFKIWTTKTGEMEWTSLSGTGKKKLLYQLPDKLLFCLHNDTRDLVVALWKRFEEVYTLLCTGNDVGRLFSKAQEFMAQFLDLGKLKREGYSPRNVTPYMHALVYHVPYFVKKYGGLSRYSGQGVEKTNDIIKQVHQKRSNKSDPTTDALLVRKRLENTKELQSRQQRKYVKQDEQYWNFGIRAARKSKQALILTEMNTANEAYRPPQTNERDVAQLSVKEIKEKLEKYGIKSKLRKKEKLLELLRSVAAE